MKKYRVKLIFRYTDTVEVEAENSEEAVGRALDECNEQYECLEDSRVTEI
jgi:hypothetical protein